LASHCRIVPACAQELSNVEFTEQLGINLYETGRSPPTLTYQMERPGVDDELRELAMDHYEGW
jgi:hypothetical protein